MDGGSNDGYFNSHAHVERDYSALDLAYKIAISTHTLTWSVTLTLSQVRVTVGISTHTLTWSVTLNRRSAQRYIKFQLTRSRGA